MTKYKVGDWICVRFAYNELRYCEVLSFEEQALLSGKKRMVSYMVKPLVPTKTSIFSILRPSRLRITADKAVRRMTKKEKNDLITEAL